MARTTVAFRRASAKAREHDVKPDDDQRHLLARSQRAADSCGNASPGRNQEGQRQWTGPCRHLSPARLAGPKNRCCPCSRSVPSGGNRTRSPPTRNLYEPKSSIISACGPPGGGDVTSSGTAKVAPKTHLVADLGGKSGSIARQLIGLSGGIRQLERVGGASEVA